MGTFHLPVTPNARNADMLIVNFVAFISRDGLTSQQPYGKPRHMLMQKAFRTLASAIQGVTDERPAPQPDDVDFTHRTREYHFRDVQIDPNTGIATAVYVEASKE